MVGRYGIGFTSVQVFNVFQTRSDSGSAAIL